MAKTFTLNSNSYDGRYLQLSCTQVSNGSAANSSTINWTLTSTGGNSNYYDTGPTNVYINGVLVYSQVRLAWNSYTFPAAKGSVSGSLTVNHNTDGSKAISCSISTAIFYGAVTSNSGNWTLDSIPRAASLVSAPHFTDEENPTITYSNPAGNAVDSLKACIASADGKYTYADYRDISKTGTSYTFNLTDEERNALRWASINSYNLAVKFYVTTVIGGVTYYSTLDKIVTIANADPILEPTVQDMGGTSVALTGDANIIIKGFNYIKVESNATPLKGASIKSQTITSGSQVIHSGSGNFENTESASFVFTATDSRGYTTTKTITKTLINYIPLTCNMNIKNPTADGKTTLNLSGNYFNGSFGAVNNTLSVQYRYKENSGDFSDWIDVEYSLSNDTYNASLEITGLDYRATYTFQARAIDKINLGILTPERKIRAIPVFDWGENDFKFNVDAYDKNGGKIGTEITATDYSAASLSGKSFLESGWVIITPTANTPTAAYVAFKKHYTKIPVVIPAASSGVIGTQVLGTSTNGITNDGVNIVLTRTNTVPTTIYYYVFGEVE